MKYCPYCGAEITSQDASLCIECGGNFSSPSSLPSPTLIDKKKGFNRKKKRKSKQKLRNKTTANETTAISQELIDECYDGYYDDYYDDIAPQDDHIVSQALDKELIKKLALLIGGVIITIGICVAIIYLL